MVKPRLRLGVHSQLHQEYHSKTTSVSLKQAYHSAHAAAGTGVASVKIMEKVVIHQHTH